MRAVDLFCGCGGLTKGAIQAGVDVVLGIDNNKMVLETYSKNHKHDVKNMDLSNIEQSVSTIQKYDPQLILGSPPCIDFSSSGKMQEGRHASLTQSFIDIVTIVSPQFVIMENVPRIHNSKSFEYAKSKLLQHGYSFVTITINSKYCGVAQSRYRLFLCATKSGPEGPRALHDFFKQYQRKALKNNHITTVKDVIPDCGDSIYFAPRNRYHPCVLDTTKPYPTLRSCKGKCMERPTSTYERRYEDVGHVLDARVMSIADASRISSFPADYIWPESRVDAGIMLGNCVPPLMAKFIISNTLELFKCTSENPPEYISHTQRVRRVQPSYMQRFASLLANCHCTMDQLIDMGTYNGGYEMKYTLGTQDVADVAMQQMLGWAPMPGWTIIIRERTTKLSKIDDVYIEVPGYKTLFRGLRGLQAMNIFP